MRTPKFETLQYEWERGATVSFEDEYDDDSVILLRAVDYSAEQKVVTVRTDQGTHDLDVRKVDTQELKEMRRVLRGMNFDSSISLSGI